jgi:glutamyl-tRNA synthetase
MKQKVRTRIAPSPTGEDLHIGTVYMALFNYVFAKQNKGDFIIRIEDTDRERFIKGGEERMLASLKWVGIPHDEGVDVGGSFFPYRQSERLSIYKKHAQELIDKGAAYYCFCSSERLSRMRLDQQKNHQPPMYDGLCKKIVPQKAAELAKTQSYVVRLNVPDEDFTQIHDRVRGLVKFENKLIDDQILIKSDGFPTYHLAVVIDDHLMQISHVIRGEEWLSSTPKHILLYQSFGWELPEYAHLPLLRNPDKSKLSKRKNPVWLSWFKKEGFLPEAILNYLATLTWSMPDNRDIFSVKDMIKNFSLSQIKTTAPIFDLTKLSWMNGVYIRQMTDAKLIEALTAYLPENTDRILVKKLVPLAKDRIKKLSEFINYLQPFIKYNKNIINKEEKTLVKEFSQFFTNLSRWTTKNLENGAKEIVVKNNLSIKDAFMAIRLAVTGAKIGLPLFETMKILGKKEVLRRIREALS